MVKTNYVIDIETMVDCTVLVVEDYKTTDQKVFSIGHIRNDIDELLTFLRFNKEHNEWHVSFNGLSFDSQITEYILRNAKKLAFMKGPDIAALVYAKAQDIIHRQNNKEFSEFSEKDLSIKQIDVFKLNHWDNPAKRSSLKWIQYSMDWYNLQDMPIHHTTSITTKEQLDIIVEYCKNDVRSTKQIMNLSKEQINLRKTLTQEYKIPLFNASEPRISKELFLMFLSEEMHVSKYELRNSRTLRDMIHIKDIILPYTKFKTETFKSLYENFYNLSINAANTKGGFKYSLKYKGVKTDFGLGGVHGCIKSGEYKSTDKMIIMSSDVVSYYPNLAIRNKWSPAHLPKEIFCKLYEWFFEERKKIPKTDPKNYVYKIILNSTYGLSNDANSFLYDPEFTMRITINGQLSLMMLYEMLAESIPDCQPLMQNTDGLEMIIPIGYKTRYLEICKEWEDITNLQLEHDQYSKMVIGDVNNYIAVNTAGKAKCKGRFEYKDLALHKNKSFLIIPKAVSAFFIDNILPEQFLQDNRNIFDYCGGVKIKGDWDFQEIAVIQRKPAKYNNYTKQQKYDFLKANGWEQSWDNDNWVRSDAANKEANTGIDTDHAFNYVTGKEATIERNTLQKTLRYYISNKGSKVFKVNKTDKREIQIESGKWMQTIFNLHVEKPWEEYDINDSYYLDKIYKEIHNICPPKQQLDLFADE